MARLPKTMNLIAGGHFCHLLVKCQTSMTPTELNVASEKGWHMTVWLCQSALPL